MARLRGVVRPTFAARVRDLSGRAHKLRRVWSKRVKVGQVLYRTWRGDRDYFQNVIHFGSDLFTLNSSAGKADSSAILEYRSLSRWLSIIGHQENLSFIDIAASNGVSQSAIWPMLDGKHAPDGLAVEVDAGKFSRLSAIYSRFPDVGLARCKVHPHNVEALLRGFEISADFDLLNIDIDSYDLEVLEAILRGGWAPKVISIEINEKIPTPIFFKVKYSPTHTWAGDHFYGCSISAAASVLSSYPYRLVQLAGNNLIAVRADLLPGSLPHQSVEEIYRMGYLELPEREKHFWYNSDVDNWLVLSTEEALGEIATYFHDYPATSFELRAAG